jgi:folate-binding protein YgfZ
MVFPPYSVIFPGVPAAWLRISGIDSAAFLQGQFSQDLRGLSQSLPGRASRAAYGLWLSHKGRVIADSFILRGAGPDEFWVGSTHSPGGTIRERLERFIIADDVAVEDRTAEFGSVALIGSGTGDWLTAEPREGWFFPGRRSADENWEWVFPRSAAPAGGFPSALALATSGPGARLGTPAELEHLRVAAGIPAVPADLGPSDLPNEGGLEGEGISYTKGCYLGQEVMARVKAMGRIRRSLVRVRGGGEPPSVPAPLGREGRQAGELRSVSRLPSERGFIGLALVGRADAEPGTILSWSAAGDPAVDVALEVTGGAAQRAWPGPV